MAGKPVVTFLFWNFSEGWWPENMRSRFNEIAKVVDLFIPSKRNKKGERFGFVRFKENIDTGVVEESLNKIWIGSFKLRAKKASFDRGGQAPKQKNSKYPGGTTISFPAFREPNRSFAEVTKKTKGGLPTNGESRKVESENWKGFSFSTSDNEKEWLNNCMIGCLKKDLVWMLDGDRIQEELGADIELSYLGGDRVLLKPNNVEDVRFFMNEQQNRLERWFSDISEWNNNKVDNNRVVWTIWFGVPLEAWTPRFFNLLSTKMGSIVRIDEDTLSHHNLQFVRILIKTPYVEIPREPLQVMIDGKLHNIIIKEEAISCRGGSKLTEGRKSTINAIVSEEVESGDPNPDVGDGG